MAGSNVAWPIPLLRMKPWFAGQFGVPGTDSERGLRADANGTVFYVDPNAVGVSDQRDGTDPESPLATVGAALLKCTPYAGDVIAVMGNNAWQYSDPTLGRALPISEQVVVNVPGVRIVGVCPSSSIGVLWTPSANAGTCITVQAADVLIEGFVFDQGAYLGCDAIYCEWNNTTAHGDNLTVRHCVFTDTVDTAIELEYVWYANIHDNFFQTVDVAAIYGNPAGSPAAYCLIYDNVFQNCPLAISVVEITDSHIFRNSIYNALAEAGVAATDRGINTGSGARNQVFDNYLSCILPPGIPVPGDFDDFCTGSVTDAWINCHLLNGMSVTTPA